MLSRAEAVKVAQKLLSGNGPRPKYVWHPLHDAIFKERACRKEAHHFGKLELRILLDHIYDALPEKAEEELL